MEKAMLTFDKVNAHYGKIQALHDVSLHINQGEIVTLIGANGAGKTTLLGTLCGDPRATSGRIVFDGKDITDWQTAKIMREAVAIVPEGRRVFSRMTVEENLAMGGFFADRDQFQTRIKWVYELFPRLWERRIQLKSPKSHDHRGETPHFPASAVYPVYRLLHAGRATCQSCRRGQVV
jgi:branched-chain amino acid transport system ATP-binding protein